MGRHPQCSSGAEYALHAPQQEIRILMPTVTGELHRSQARFSLVNFTEYPRFLMPANTE
jgi:hypothetical protein